LLSVVKASTSRTINVKEISRLAILIAGILLRENEVDPVTGFQSLIQENVGGIREYLKKLTLDVSNYPFAASRYLPVYQQEFL
jgi:hypothetical protein